MYHACNNAQKHIYFWALQQQFPTCYLLYPNAKEENATIQPLHEYRIGFLLRFESDKEQQKANQLPDFLPVQEA